MHGTFVFLLFYNEILQALRYFKLRHMIHFERIFNCHIVIFQVGYIIRNGIIRCLL